MQVNMKKTEFPVDEFKLKPDFVIDDTKKNEFKVIDNSNPKKTQ